MNSLSISPFLSPTAYPNHYRMMRFAALWICGLLLVVGGKGVRAWGGVFNRFSPEMLSNMGYGSHGGSSYRPQPLFQVSI
jgi:hypothetical protein